MKYECGIHFFLAPKAVIRMLFKNDFAKHSFCDSHQNATNTLQAIFRINSQFSSATNSADIGTFWIPNWVIRRLEAVSKTMWFVAYLRYSVQSHDFLHMLPKFPPFLFVPSRNRLYITFKHETVFSPIRPTDASPARR